jgi:DNA-binding NtrC family response regulator
MSGQMTTAHTRVMVVDDHARARESMADILKHAGHDVVCCASAAEALRSIHETEVDLVITDLRMPGMSGLDLIRELDRRRSDAQVVMVTAHASVESAVEAMRYGAFDYIEKPFDAQRLESLVARALEAGLALRQRSGQDGGEEQAPAVLVGGSPAMQTLRRRLAQVAATHETVLITGESGTGKELVARRIHLESRRAHRPLISLNCPALSPQLMESELFGHERGAFTSADAARVGRFELAEGGTLLLDEITEIDINLQAKLLRVLQEKSYERVGSSSTRTADVRVLATTNRQLHDEVKAGRFREDLFYRLNVLPLDVPPLRERRDDVDALVDHFRRLVARRLDRGPLELDRSAQQLLREYHWPGNVRELENIVTRASVLLGGQPATADDLHPWLIDAPHPVAAEGHDVDGFRVGTSLQEMERRLIEATLEHFQGHRLKAAEALGIGVRTLSNKLRGYGYAPRAKTFQRVA